MKVQKNALVKLTRWDTPEDVSHPLWGGMQGAIGGTVTAVCTHAHTAEEHSADVLWTNGEKCKIKNPDKYLSFLPKGEAEFADEWRRTKGLLAKDIFILVRTEDGRYALNMVEARSTSAIDQDPGPGFPVRYFAAVTKFAFPDISHKTDCELIGKTLSFPDMVEQGFHTLYAALTHVASTWGIKPPMSYPAFPFGQVTNIAEVVSSKKDETSGIAIFHLPHNICDYSVAAS